MLIQQWWRGGGWIIVRENIDVETTPLDRHLPRHWFACEEATPTTELHIVIVIVIVIRITSNRTSGHPSVSSKPYCFGTWVHVRPVGVAARQPTLHKLSTFAPSTAAPYGVTPWCPCLRTGRGTCKGCRVFRHSARQRCPRQRCPSCCRLLACSPAPCSWNKGAGTFEESRRLYRTNLCYEDDGGGPPWRGKRNRGTEHTRQRAR